MRSSPRSAPRRPYQCPPPRDGRASRGAAELASPAWEAVDLSVPPPARPRFVRFAVVEKPGTAGVPQGVFHAAADLIKAGVMPRGEKRQLDETRLWFDENLHAPRNIRRDAVFWFRADATEMFARLWDLLRILQAHGRHVTAVRADDIGMIVWQDRHQAAAVPGRGKHQHHRKKLVKRQG
ncbi:MAG: hypothetical protein ACFCVE_14755 [Phycisphaerae bacterium]